MPKSCPNCGAVNPDAALRCACGADLTKVMPARSAPRGVPPAAPAGGAEEEEWDDEPPRRRRPRLPGTVLAAGIIWVVIGGLILLSFAVFMLILFSAPQPAGPADPRAGFVCVGLLGALFGAVFVHVGIQSIRGTAKDTLGNGIGSLVFGLLQAGAAALQGAAGRIPQAGTHALFAAGLLAAGVLALVGRSEYKAWRRASQARSRGNDSRT
jgi:hypothetical protein